MQNHYNRYGSYATVQFQGWISAIQSFAFLFNFNMWYEKILKWVYLPLSYIKLQQESANTW